VLVVVKHYQLLERFKKNLKVFTIISDTKIFVGVIIVVRL
jgi:hypothetical protein